MARDPYALLDVAIEASALKREIKKKQSDDEYAAMVRQREEATAIWSQRKLELPAIVQVIDRKLKDHGFAGVTLGVFDLKHSDIGRAVLEFEHGPHNVTKILFCVTRSGEFTCSIGALTGYMTSSQGPIAELSEDRFKATLAQAVSACLSGNPASAVAADDEAVQQVAAKKTNTMSREDVSTAIVLNPGPRP